MAVELTQTNVLIVEGREEELFFGALIEHLGLQNIQIMPIGGKEQLRRNLKALARSPSFAKVVSLGIVRDANANPRAAFQSVRDALQAVNLPAPDRPLIPTGRDLQVTVMIVPAEDTPGMLEDLCLRSVLSDPATPCMEQYFQCLQQRDLPLPRNMPKARVQAFLASRREAGKRLGEAARAGYWPWNEAAFEPVKDFLQQVGSRGTACSSV
jgi:hypothetical protein